MNASPSGRRITVRSVSCRGVKSFVPFQKPPLYVAVSLGGRREKTPADPDGGENPDWDGAVFGFDFVGAGEGDGGGGDGLLQFEVKAQVPLLGTKLVGRTCVPVSHLISGGADGTVPRSVSYQVLAPDGKPNGSLRFVCASTGGGAYHQPQPQPQIYAAPNGAQPEQDLSPCCAPPPAASCLVYPPPAAMTNFEQGSGYPPPPVPASLYPPLHDMLPPSDYPTPPRMMDSLFPASNSGPNSSYPLPPAPPTAYPPPPASFSANPVPSPQQIGNHPPPPTRYYPPPPPSGYPSPQMSPEFPAPTNSYPPPPESGSMLPRSVDRELPYMVPLFQNSVVTYPQLPGPRVHSGGYYPPSGIRHHEDGASSPYYHPHHGPRYSYG